jgi:Calcium binding
MTHTELETLIEEAIVDCYNDHEQVTSLFTMIDEHLAVPFDTEVLGVTATVTKVELTIDHEIIAICRRDTQKQTIPILDLPLPTPPPDGAEWIEAYRRWRR